MIKSKFKFLQMKFKIIPTFTLTPEIFYSIDVIFLILFISKFLAAVNSSMFNI